ncbi:MAG: lipopolysaccharide biosynthesis protein [Candidatus Dormibacteria bacterium]
MGREALREDTRGAIGAGGLLMGAGLIGGVGNLGFNVLVAHGGGVASYGAIASLLTIATVAGFFATGSQYAVAHLAAVAFPGRRGLLGVAFRAVSPWLILSLALLAGAVPLSSYLHLASVWPVMLAAVLLAATILGAAPTGLLVGGSRFRVVAVIAVSATGARLVLGAWLGRGSDTVAGALLASLVPVVLAALAGVLVVKLSRPARARPAPPEAVAEPLSPRQSGLVARGAIGALIAGASWGIWTLPVLAARHLLSVDEAGVFAGAQLLAGSIIYVTAPLVTAFYPTLARGRDRQTVWVGLLATAAIAALGVLGLGLIGPWLVPILYGPQFHPGSELLFDLGASAAVTTVAGFACWAGVARSRAYRPLLVGLTTALLGGAVLCAFWAHSANELGATPAMALSLGGLGAGLTHWLAPGELRLALGRLRAGETGT